jgi:hypothetical protein
MSIYSNAERQRLVAGDPEGGPGAAYIIGRAETFATETPDAPAWVAKDAAGRWMWVNDLAWRCNAAAATTAQYRRQLLRDAARVRDYHGR